MRVDDWQERFSAVVKAQSKKRFRWGRSDCFTFVSNVIVALTGAPPGFNHRYTSRAQITSYVKQNGGMIALVSRDLGPKMDPVYAMVGDIGVTDNGGELLCLCVNNGSTWLALGRIGIVHIPTSLVLHSWKL